MNTPLCLEWLKPCMRWERADELWFDPFYYSGVWSCPPWSYDVLYRTPGGTAPAVEGLCVARPLRFEVDDRHAGHHLQACLELKPAGLDLFFMRDDWVPAILNAAPTWLRLGLGTRLTEAGWQKLAQLSGLTHLVVDVPVDDVTMGYIARMRGLKTLCVKGRDVTDAALTDLPAVEALSLEGTHVSDAGLRALADCPLRLLDLSVSQVRGPGLAFLPDTLEDLNLRGNTLEEKAAGHLSHLSNLRFLNIGADGVPPLPKLHSLGTVLCDTADTAWMSAFPQLQRLSLNRSLGLPADLSSFSHLRELTLADCGIDDAQLSTLRGSTSLRSLDLKSTAVTGAGLASGFPALARLNLFNCLSVTEAGLMAVAALPALEQLNLGSCAFVYETEQSCGLTDAMVGTLHRSASLHHVGLAGNFISGSGIDSLRRSLPQCRIDGSPLELTTTVDTTRVLVEAGDAEGLRDLALRLNSSVPWFELARMEETAGHLREALEAATRALGLCADAQMLMVRARCLARIGDPDAARRDLERALTVSPLEHRLCIVKAELSLDGHNMEQALLDFADYIERQTGPTGNAEEWAQTVGAIYVNCAYACIELKRYAEAAADALIAIAAEPDNVIAWENLGEAQLGQGLAAEAAASYSRAIALQADRVDLFVGRARAALQTGDKAAARADLVRVQELEPAHIDLPELLAAVHV